MISFRTSTDVDANRQVVVKLPPETPLGKADLVVMIVPHQSGNLQPGGLRRHFGALQSGDAHSADNDLIDRQLAQEYSGERGN